MIAVDTNLLVYAHREDSEFHKVARKRLEALRQGGTAWAVPWPCVHEFIAIVTHDRIYRPPSPLETVFAAVDAWGAAGNLEFLAESPGYLAKLRELARAARVKGPRIHDARVAALCLHHGVRELWTADRDFSPFPKLKIRNPLVEG
jgi:toxin-antitoxin system PIN domain toxin